MYNAFYFEKLEYEETSKKESDVKFFFKYLSRILINGNLLETLFKYMSWIDSSNGNLLEILFFNQNQEKLSCFDLILANDTYKNFLYYLLKLSKSFSKIFFDYLDKDNNNCLYVAALNKCAKLYHMLIDKILEETNFDYINKTNSDLSSIDVLVLNNDYNQFNLLIKKLKGKIDWININTETYIALIENIEKVDKIEDVNSLIIKSKLKFNSLMKIMVNKNSEFLAKRLLKFIDIFDVEMSIEAFEVLRIIYEYKWSENFFAYLLSNRN